VQGVRREGVGLPGGSFRCASATGHEIVRFEMNVGGTVFPKKKFHFRQTFDTPSFPIGEICIPREMSREIFEPHSDRSGMRW
jgi:hypothetical protein